jgi:hypothetical protein
MDFSRARSLPVVETVVVQPTPFCNINCRYCYLPDRNVSTVIEQSTVAALFSKLFETNEISRDGQLSALSDSAGSSLGFPDEVYYPHQLDLHLEPIGARRVL